MASSEIKETSMSKDQESHGEKLHDESSAKSTDQSNSFGDTLKSILNNNNPLGNGTKIELNDQGRIDIEIDQKNDHISSLLNKTIVEQARDQKQIEETSNKSPIPKLNIVIHVVGSRGDVQPFVALGQVLKNKYGHRVRLATHLTFRNFVIENGLEFFNIGGDPAELMAFMVKNPGLMPGFSTLRSGDVGKRRLEMSEMIKGCWRSCIETGDGTGVEINNSTIEEWSFDNSNDYLNQPFIAGTIIANPPSFAHIHCAEKLSCPLHVMFTMPYSPTQAFPHPLANIKSTNLDPSLTNYLTYLLVDMMTWQGLGDIINRFRENILNLEPINVLNSPGILNRLKVSHTYCWSPILIPKPKDWSSNIYISGFFFLSSDKSKYTPTDKLQSFLSNGSTPIYIGFGSIVVDDPTKMTKMMIDAVKKSGQRALISKGWGGIGLNELDIPDSIMILDKDIPHDWLFDKVSCVIHHGGAGTTAAGISAGKPTIIIPFFGDQPFWGSMVHKAGAGPEPVLYKDLTSDKLVELIKEALKGSTIEKAKMMAKSIEKENGCEDGANFFHKQLDINSMRCELCPNRITTWLVKERNIKLSTFAFTTLLKESLLELKDVELYQSYKYQLNHDPTDPITGGAGSIIGTASNIMMGFADFPPETLKLLGIHPDKNKTDTSGKAVAKADISQQIQTALNTSKGIGRILESSLRSPIEFTNSLSKGFHNAPKLYNDSTVREYEPVTSLQTGIASASKGFGYGLYDGITGLLTHPINGMKEEGSLGFIKGFGKGIGGIILKPTAGAYGIPAGIMKGIYEQVRSVFGTNGVEGYILASRTAQGLQEYELAGEEERKDVVAGWNKLVK